MPTAALLLPDPVIYAARASPPPPHADGHWRLRINPVCPTQTWVRSVTVSEEGHDCLPAPLSSTGADEFLEFLVDLG